MRFEEVTLHTNRLRELEVFYGGVLGFEILSSSGGGLTLRTGRSLLHFRASETPAYYHFAFNIPSFDERRALEWLRERVEILPDEQGRPVVDFVNWNAKALYFFDPAENVVEFIARRNLNLPSGPAFGSESIQSISELGLPVESPEGAHRQIEHFLQEQDSALALSRFWGDYDEFGASGDEEGLFILVDRRRKLWYPTTKPARPFPLSAKCRMANRSFFLQFDGARLLLG